MISDYKRLEKYFKEKYNLSATEARQYVADELAVGLLYLLSVVSGQVTDEQLDRAARDTVDVLLPDKPQRL